MNSTPRPAPWRFLLLAGALLVVLLFKGGVVAPPAVRTESLPGVFDTHRAIARLARILGDGKAHPVDSAAGDQVRERLLEEIEALRFTPLVRDDFVCTGRFAGVGCARVRNIVFRVGPAGGDAVMVTSHYDSVPAGPGAADDGIGVAVSLELAAMLAAQPPAHPVIFLFTEGEEGGLLGAKSFVETDPLANAVRRVINLEARGVRGPALMFETATPNGADVRIFAAGASRPFANSLMTDVYKLMPNDTDVSEFLPRGYGAINFALIEGVGFYHTPLDSLTNLDPRSVQHMGDQALGTLRSALAGEAASGQLAFTDILSRFMILMPEWMAVALVVVSGLVAVFFFWRAGGARPLRALLVPPSTLVLAGAFGWLASLLFGALRSERPYWSAAPLVFQATGYLCAALAAAVALALVGRGASRARLVAAAWIWMAVLGSGAWFVAPGASILFALPLAVFAMAARASLAWPRVLLPGASLAALAALVIFAPTLHLAEIGLGLGLLAIPALVAALLFMLAAPLALDDEARLARSSIAAVALPLVVALGAGFFVPAWSQTKPQLLNIQYLADADTRSARWIVGTETTPAPYLEQTPPEIVTLGETAEGAGRRLRFALVPNGADRVSLSIPSGAVAGEIVAAGRRIHVPNGKGDTRRLNCYGRACAGKEFEIVLTGKPGQWLIQGVKYGLPASSLAPAPLRPERATAGQEGDVTIVSRRQRV